MSEFKIEKVVIYTQFGLKSTHISGFKDVHIYNLAIVTMHISTITIHLIGTEPRFEPKGGPKHEPKKFQVTWFIKKKKKNHGRQNNCTLLP